MCYLVGENNLKENSINIKDISSGNQKLVAIDSILDYINDNSSL